MIYINCRKPRLGFDLYRSKKFSTFLVSPTLGVNEMVVVCINWHFPSDRLNTE